MPIDTSSAEANYAQRDNIVRPEVLDENGNVVVRDVPEAPAPAVKPVVLPVELA